MHMASIGWFRDSDSFRGERMGMMFGVGDGSDFGSKFNGGFSEENWWRKSLEYTYVECKRSI